MNLAMQLFVLLEYFITGLCKTFELRALKAIECSEINELL